MKPRKRLLSEFLEPELLQLPAAKVKRQRGSRWGTGVSASPVATSVAPVNGGQPAEGSPDVLLPAIQEEEEPGEPVQANSNQTPVNNHPSTTDYPLNANQVNENIHDVEPAHAGNSHIHYAPSHQSSTGQNGSQHPYEGYSHGDMASSGYSNLPPDSIPLSSNDSNNSLANSTGSNNIASSSMVPNSSSMSYATSNNTHQRHIPHGAQSDQATSLYVPHNPYGTVVGSAATEQAPIGPSSVSFSVAVDPSLENYAININSDGTQNQPGGSAGNQASSIPQQNSADSNLSWSPDEAANERH